MFPKGPKFEGALCAGSDTLELWDDHPDHHQPGVRPDTDALLKAGKAICKRCPVRAACGQYGIDHPEEVGVWGGLTQAERVELATGGRSSLCQACAAIIPLMAQRLSWRQISIRLGHQEDWAGRHAARHGLRETEAVA